MPALIRLPGLRRLPRLLLPLAAVSLLFGLLGGLVRLGWVLPLPGTDLMLLHGPLMVVGFFGTLIALERAVALQSVWVYGAPALTGAGGLLLAAGQLTAIAALAFVIGGLIYLMAAVWLNARHRVLHIAVLTLGAISLFVGDLLWLLGWAVPNVVLWWLAFLVLTIAGERLELSRLLQPPIWARRVFMVIVLALVTGVTAGSRYGPPGWRLLGAALMCLTLWLARYDIARRTIHAHGVARFSAVCLLSGYAWLGLAGVAALASADATGGFLYDAILHAVFVGFVFAMVLGHAPIILPAVLHVAVPFTRVFYAPLAVLHVSLVLRVAGDLLIWEPGRLWGGMIGALAILGFMGTVAASAAPSRSNQTSL